ncbi:MAG: hypothetical protein IPM79_25025 [Polyangiaceae bacterium]|jgi:hypothetical protein|nr:hypothetical protein [Polyangiaceae bacterium]MBK8940790.1 hypothetical protein [Polyangiaceae bacterium]
MRRCTAVVLLLLASASCTPAARPVAAPSSPAPTPAPLASKPDPDAGRAPTPYTAEQIRAATPAGRTMTYLIESPGKLPTKQRFRFVAVDDEHATVATEILGDDGKVMGDPEVKISSWDDLRRHASYPREATTIAQTVTVTPDDSFKCKRYTVVEAQPDGKTKRTIACFANDLPGPPVELTVELDGALVMSMTLVKHEPP